MANETFAAEEVREWSKRDEAEADSHLKRTIGEVFYHGLNCLVPKDVRIQHLEHSLDTLTAQEASHCE